MRKQKLMRMAAMTAAGMILMAGSAGDSTQATTAAATECHETTQAPETTAPETTEGENAASEADGAE